MWETIFPVDLVLSAREEPVSPIGLVLSANAETLSDTIPQSVSKKISNGKRGKEKPNS
jgi:hypothetical protein